MFKRLTPFCMLFALPILHACQSGNAAEEAARQAFTSLIPRPVEASPGEGFFTLTDSTVISADKNVPQLERLGSYLSGLLQPSTGMAIPVKAEDGSGRHRIRLMLTSDSALGQEGYFLQIADSMITLQAHQPAGIFYGIQTLRQLLPPSIEKKEQQPGPWLLAAGTIRDQPAFALRGSMLDVARHFFGVADIKRYIDLLAYYKMNTLHLHLSDDQGWRIEIKKWPRLTEYGGSTQVGGGKGGFYTQEQYKEIVQYAADRFITIIPEIDMPGHTNAALASYPELNCNPKDPNPKLYTGIEVGFSTFCTTNEKVYGFVEDVVQEIAAITPVPYFHMGGDESHVTPKEEYIQFVNRVQGIINKHGKQVIGWDEIATATLLPNSIAQYWSDSTNPKRAVQQGAKLILSPAKRAYMDMQYDSTTRLGLHWAGYIEVDDAYNWDPATLVDSVGTEHMLGIVAPLWTETILNMEDIEYMVFPRLPGYAEIGWSPADGRSWDEYKQRLGRHARQMQAMDINFYRSARVAWADK
jgi:hexosaminidase